MTFAVGFGIVAAVCLLALGALWWRRFGGAGLAQLVAGQLIVAGAEEVNFYGTNHSWHTTHHYAGLLLLPAPFVGLACICWGAFVGHRSKPTGGTAADTHL